MSDKQNAELVSNRRARHDYEILDTYEAGLVLKGTEIKSLRNHGGSLQEAYVKIIKGEAYLIGAHIAQYRFGNVHNHEERRDRKLLLHKRELKKMGDAVQLKGQTLMPLGLYLKKGKAKLKVGLCRGKKLIDKRRDLKEKSQKRDIEKAMKQSM